MNLFALLMLLAAASAQTPSVEVAVLDADPRAGQLTALDERGLEITSSEGPQRIGFDAVLGVTFPAAAPSPPVEPRDFIETIDGSSLLATQAECSAERAALVRVDGARLDLPRSAVRALRFRPLDDASLAEWDKLVEGATLADRVIVERDGALDFLEGVVEQVGPEKVRFRMDDEVRELPRVKLTGVALQRAPSQTAPPAPLGRLIDRHGGVAVFAKIAQTDTGLRVESAAGWSADWPWSEIRRLDFSTGKLLALTDLEPERTEYTPDPLWSLPGAGESLRAAYAPRFDVGFAPGPLLLGGRAHTRGVAARGRSQITYRLPEGYRRFTALVGIDDHLRPRGDAVLTIRADEQTLSKSRLVGGEAPTALDLTIADHHRLTIVVEAGQHGDVADVVLLVNPRLSK